MADAASSPQANAVGSSSEPQADAVGSSSEQSSNGKKRSRELNTSLTGRLGAVSRGEYVIVVKCACDPYPDYGCNCHVAIFWKDEAGHLNRDCEEMFKAELEHVFDELIDFSKGFLRMPCPVQPDGPVTVDAQVWDVAHLDNLRSEFWFGVRIYLEAVADGVGRLEELPKAFAKCMQGAKPGTVIRLQTQGEDAATTAIAAIGGTWKGGQLPALSW